MALTVSNTKKAATKALNGQSCYPIGYIRGGDLDATKVFLAPDAHSGTGRVDLPLDSHLSIEPTNDEMMPAMKACRDCRLLWTACVHCGKAVGSMQPSKQGSITIKHV